MGVSKNNGTPKSSISIGSIINHPFWGTRIFGNTHIYSESQSQRVGEQNDLLQILNEALILHTPARSFSFLFSNSRGVQVRKIGVGEKNSPKKLTVCPVKIGEKGSKFKFPSSNLFYFFREELLVFGEFNGRSLQHWKMMMMMMMMMMMLTKKPRWCLHILRIPI